MSGEPIDLHHHRERVIGSYVLETDERPALFDCGPTTCVAALEEGLSSRGLELQDVRHLSPLQAGLYMLPTTLGMLR